MSNRSDQNLTAFVIIALLLMIAYVVLQFSTLFGLDFYTSVKVIAGMGVWAIATIGMGGSWRKNCWPLLLGGLGMCWWPALDYRAMKEVEAFRYPGLTAVWWDLWYTKVGAIVGIVAFGYLVKKKMLDD